MRLPDTAFRAAIDCAIRDSRDNFRATRQNLRFRAFAFDLEQLDPVDPLSSNKLF